LRVDPLTEAELATELEGWQGILKAKASEVAVAEIAVNSDPSPEEKAELLKTISALQKEKAAVIERFDIVTSPYELKGGDPGPFARYAAAVGGIKTDVTDGSSTWFYVTDWLQSKEGGIKLGMILNWRRG